MWPIGYLIASPYSPLQLESDVGGFNWRDRFEDLIALENGGEMISMESRRREAKVGHRLMFEGTRRLVDCLNADLRRNHRWLTIVNAWRQIARDDNMTQNIARADRDILPAINARNDEVLSHGKATIELAREIRDRKTAAASNSKSPGLWMSSLITSGALKGWMSIMANSNDGPYYKLRKTTDDSDDGQCFTDLELMQKFKGGIPISVGSPNWSTMDAPYPRLPSMTGRADDGTFDGSLDLQTYKQLSIKRSILRQLASAEEVKYRNGTKATKVFLVNHYTDGSMERKEIIQDPVKVLQEVNEAQAQMELYRDAMLSEPEDWMLEAHEKDIEQRMGKGTSVLG
ncbi:MAG: hypothetical protein Q9217_000615 [Psora testacea]